MFGRRSAPGLKSTSSSLSGNFSPPKLSWKNLRPKCSNLYGDLVNDGTDVRSCSMSMTNTAAGLLPVNIFKKSKIEIVWKTVKKMSRFFTCCVNSETFWNWKGPTKVLCWKSTLAISPATNLFVIAIERLSLSVCRLTYKLADLILSL